jgi:hypothetical protein
VQTAKAAAESDPDQIHYLFELAALYLLLEDFDAVERTILAAESKMDLSGFRHGVLRDLKRILQQARENAGRARAAGG